MFRERKALAPFLQSSRVKTTRVQLLSGKETFMQSNRLDTLSALASRLTSGEINRTKALEMIGRETVDLSLNDELARRAAEFVRSQIFQNPQR